MSQLDEDESWMIVENLMESYYSLEEMGHQDTASKVAAVLDKLSPNWREADSCREVKTRQLTVNGDESVEGENQE